MLQALATLGFSAMTMLSLVTIVLLLRNDWKNVVAAFGMGRTAPVEAPIASKVRAKPARRAIMVRVEIPELQQRAAA